MLGFKPCQPPSLNCFFLFNFLHSSTLPSNPQLLHCHFTRSTSLICVNQFAISPVVLCPLCIPFNLLQFGVPLNLLDKLWGCTYIAITAAHHLYLRMHSQISLLGPSWLCHTLLSLLPVFFLNLAFRVAFLLNFILILLKLHNSCSSIHLD